MDNLCYNCRIFLPIWPAFYVSIFGEVKPNLSRVRTVCRAWLAMFPRRHMHTIILINLHLDFGRYRLGLRKHSKLWDWKAATDDGCHSTKLKDSINWNVIGKANEVAVLEC